MRHLRSTAKLGRKGQHRNAMLANLVCSLIKKRKVTTTLAKAKAACSIAEKMVTLGKKNTQHARRLAASRPKTSARISSAARCPKRQEVQTSRTKKMSCTSFRPDRARLYRS